MYAAYLYFAGETYEGVWNEDIQSIVSSLKRQQPLTSRCIYSYTYIFILCILYLRICIFVHLCICTFLHFYIFTFVGAADPCGP